MLEKAFPSIYSLVRAFRRPKAARPLRPPVTQSSQGTSTLDQQSIPADAQPDQPPPRSNRQTAATMTAASTPQPLQNQPTLAEYDARAGKQPGQSPAARTSPTQSEIPETYTAGQAERDIDVAWGQIGETTERAREDLTSIQGIRDRSVNVRTEAQQVMEEVESIQEEAELQMAQARQTFAKAIALNPEALRSMAATVRTLEEAIRTQRLIRQQTRQQAEEEADWLRQKATDAILNAVSEVRKAANHVSRELEESRRIMTTAETMKRSSQEDLNRVKAIMEQAENLVRREARRLLDQPHGTQPTSPLDRFPPMRSPFERTPPASPALGRTPSPPISRRTTPPHQRESAPNPPQPRAATPPPSAPRRPVQPVPPAEIPPESQAPPPTMPVEPERTPPVRQPAPAPPPIQQESPAMPPMSQDRPREPAPPPQENLVPQQQPAELGGQTTPDGGPGFSSQEPGEPTYAMDLEQSLNEFLRSMELSDLPGESPGVEPQEASSGGENLSFNDLDMLRQELNEFQVPPSQNDVPPMQPDLRATMSLFLNHRVCSRPRLARIPPAPNRDSNLEKSFSPSCGIPCLPSDKLKEERRPRKVQAPTSSNRFPHNR